MNRVLTCIVLLGLLLTACVKNQGDWPKGKPDSTEAKSNIVAIGGTSQTDTVGKELVESIVVKINEPGSRLNKLFVKIFQQTLCNGDSVIERTIKNGETISFKWRLNSRPGVQTLNFKVLDSALNVIDSIKVTATAIAPKPGWHVASCTISENVGVKSFAMLSTGRLLVCYSGSIKPQYSDDNGVSWHSFSYTDVMYTDKVIVSPTDEIYLAANNNSVYYSSGIGGHWERMWITSWNTEWCRDLAFLPDGRLLYTSMDGGIFIRNKKGENFVEIEASYRPTGVELRYMAETAEGDIYFISQFNFATKLVKLDHTTQKLTDVTGLPVTDATSFFMDDKGVMFAGGYNKATGFAELHRSDDKGITWNKIFSYKYPSIFYYTALYNFTKQVDNNYYFRVGTAYFKTADLKTFAQIDVPFNTFATPYIVAKNNYFIVNSYPLVLQYLVP
ncbi:ligand-binding sensor domain-containing protein [Mucilaginibacter gilvus]|uniref:Exo-alpha-sialidase n=1 Tax=Mucilaginibacter gilvus TaxID=2305909 RepID=A0A3S3UVK5_9SPHI|nr:sialidase family protein [Mucilaginibacter gilvus]RWY49137.1 exo-alpha-sialidase [Mucilaginibacter gilvus]